MINDLKTIAEVEKQISFRVQKMQSLYKEIARLNARKSEIIKSQNDCPRFNPLISIIKGHSDNCQDCGHLESEHKD